MSNELDFSISPWFADSEEPGATGLFEVPTDEKKLVPYSELSGTVKLLELRVYHTLKNYKFGMFSESKKIIKQLHSNFKKYSSKLPERSLFDDLSPQKKLNKMAEVENLIESDNKKIVALYSKIYSKCKNEKDENKPRIMKGDNEKILFKGLDNLLKFAQKCVDKQEELLMDETTEKGKKIMISSEYDKKTDKVNEEYTESKIEQLVKAFTDKNDPFGNQFIVNFPKNETVKEYIKKRPSKTGKLLKDICKIINSCDKAFYTLDSNIQKTLYSCKEVDDKSFDKSFEKITNDKNNYKKYISQLNTAINAYVSLVDILCSVSKYRGKMTKLISLYDPRVKKSVSELVKKLKNQIGIYKVMKNILENQ